MHHLLTGQKLVSYRTAQDAGIKSPTATATHLSRRGIGVELCFRLCKRQKAKRPAVTGRKARASNIEQSHDIKSVNSTEASIEAMPASEELEVKRDRL